MRKPGPKPSRRRGPAFYVEAPEELYQAVKLLCVTKRIYVADWIRNLMIEEVKKEAAKAGVDHQFLTGEARLEAMKRTPRRHRTRGEAVGDEQQEEEEEDREVEEE